MNFFLGLLLFVFSLSAFGGELPIGKWVAEDSDLELYIKNKDSVYLKGSKDKDKDKVKMKLELRGGKLFISNNKVIYDNREGSYSLFLQELDRRDTRQYRGHYSNTPSATLDIELDPRGYIIKNSTIVFIITSNKNNTRKNTRTRGNWHNQYREVFNKYIENEEVSSYLRKLDNDQILKTIAHKNYVRFHNEKVKEARKIISAERAKRIFKKEQQKKIALIQLKERVKKENEEYRIRLAKEKERAEKKRRRIKEKNRKKDEKDLANEAISKENEISKKILELAKDKVFPFGVWHSTKEENVILYLNSLEDMYIAYGDDCKGSLYLKRFSFRKEREKIVNEFKLHTWKWEGCKRPVERLLVGGINKSKPDLLEVFRLHRNISISDKLVRYDEKGESLEDVRVRSIPMKIKEDFIEGEITKGNFMELKSLIGEMLGQMRNSFKLGNKEEASKKMKVINEIDKKIIVKLYNQGIDLEKENKNEEAYFSYLISTTFGHYFFTENRIEYNTRYIVPNALYNKALMLTEGRGVERNTLDAWWDFQHILTPQKNTKVVGTVSKELRANTLYNIALLNCKFPIGMRSRSLFSRGSNEELQAEGYKECATSAKKALDLGYDKTKIDSLMEAYNLVLPR